MVLIAVDSYAQNVYSSEPVQWVGRPNGYSTTPYNSDYRTTVYRKLSTTTANPADGRGQWSTTINVQNAGGDIAPDNMPGGGGAGWLLISGPLSNRFQNKWNFNGIGQGALNAYNDVVLQLGGQDMGLNMGTSGYYHFNFRDAGYVNSNFFVGYTLNAPVTCNYSSLSYNSITHNAQLSVSTSATPSSGEGVFVRYRVGTNDFTASTSVVEATGSGTSWTATIPAQTCSTTVYFYVFTSTRSLAQLNTDSEQNRFLAALRYDDNSGNNYSYTNIPITATCSGTNVTCLGGINGSASVNSSGGTSAYSYLWNNGNTNVFIHRNGTSYVNSNVQWCQCFMQRW
ncbi:MAG: SprB repeat-containing protein [Bacteroidetes bacterium]|nr:SprB repeat-containing protein [Bacteroidota bacterium]